MTCSLGMLSVGVGYVISLGCCDWSYTARDGVSGCLLNSITSDLWICTKRYLKAESIQDNKKNKSHEMGWYRLIDSEVCFQRGPKVLR